MRSPAVASRGLSRITLSGGVQNATQRCELPAPSVAVRNLVEQAQHAHLCTVMSAMHHRRAGYPFGTAVEFAADGAGHPILCLSPLALHMRNLLEDPRASLVMNLPGWTGLANARVTMFGDVRELPASSQADALDLFQDKYAQQFSLGGPDSARKPPRWLSANRRFFCMDRIQDVYFVGGFGTVQWVDVEEYLSAKPDAIVMDNPALVLKTLSDRFAVRLFRKLGCKTGKKEDAKKEDAAAAAAPAADAAVISIDRLGADVRVGSGADTSVERIAADRDILTLDDALAVFEQFLA
ncbi:hypothetical protein H632_c412p1 [Helicosporidium sp. ATCC 50920]|nr:hypothetical protein H632_c412p1 [Helicosporidium sp. ATCC 50920]|eukprot:KDD75973.1 hypothetical protein H632_c412p1 [Helicosporidium sp. ATCC 50920]